jgi:predicted O-methyltransferase YrrM
MKKILITDKLEEIDFSLDYIKLGDFDYIGEYTAKKNRNPESDLYKTAGCFFRPNYERGILLYSLVSTFEIESYLEIGFGRGYSAFCVAKAMCDKGIDGKIVTIDPGLDKDFLSNLSKVFPGEWFDKIQFVKGTSQEGMRDIKEKFDMVYIDGDHRYDAVKLDWDMTKKLYNKFLIFDDYHLPTKEQKDMEVSKVVDNIKDKSKELIITDRRIFFDDRGYSDDDIDYGQVILTNKKFDTSDYVLSW